MRRMDSSLASPSSFERACASRGLRMTAPRRAVLRVLANAADHPSAPEIHRRAQQLGGTLALSTVYRTLNLLENRGVIRQHMFGSEACYEMISDEPHDHLIDLDSGAVLEFRDDTFERMKAEIAGTLGYRLVECRVALYGRAREGAE